MIEIYCQIANYCYACFLVDQQDPVRLFGGLCYHCHSEKWDKMRHSFTTERIVYHLNNMDPKSDWYSLYKEELKQRSSQ